MKYTNSMLRRMIISVWLLACISSRVSPE